LESFWGLKITPTSLDILDNLRAVSVSKSVLSGIWWKIFPERSASILSMCEFAELLGTSCMEFCTTNIMIVIIITQRRRSLPLRI
jgi:hypothetical protein